jgi:hypothetical protein
MLPRPRSLPLTRPAGISSGGGIYITLWQRIPPSRGNYGGKYEKRKEKKKNVTEKGEEKKIKEEIEAERFK